jgi:hypothetical protein
MFHETASVHHATSSAHHLREYYTEALERVVERLFRSDYDHPVLNLTRSKMFMGDDFVDDDEHELSGM